MSIFNQYQISILGEKQINFNFFIRSDPSNFPSNLIFGLNVRPWILGLYAKYVLCLNFIDLTEISLKKLESITFTYEIVDRLCVCIEIEMGQDCIELAHGNLNVAFVFRKHDT